MLDVTRFRRDDESAGCCHHISQRMTIVCRQRSIRQKICVRDQSQLQIRKSKLSQPLPNTLRQSLYLIYNRRKISNSQSNIFDALSAFPVSLKGCVLWKRRAFTVRTMACARNKLGGRVS